MGTIANIVHGPLSVGVDISPTTDLLNTYVDMGYTQGGLKLNYEAEIEFVEVDQETFHVDGMLVRESLEGEVIIAEPTGANAAIAMAGASYSDPTLMIGPNAGSSLGKMALELVGEAPDQGSSYVTRTVEVALAYAINPVELSHVKDDNTKMPLAFKAIKDGTNPVVTVLDAV